MSCVSTEGAYQVGEQQHEASYQQCANESAIRNDYSAISQGVPAGYSASTQKVPKRAVNPSRKVHTHCASQCRQRDLRTAALLLLRHRRLR